MSAANGHDTWPPVPNGWFAVAWSKDLVPGDVRRIRYFDQELVLFRTRSGAARVLDAYCSHLGAHLAEGGTVIGECIRCPFHHWHYDGDGACVQIPYAKKIPAQAKVRSWPVTECNEMIFVGHHAEGNPPLFDFPAMPEFSHPDWTPPRYFDLEVPVHMQDMAENNCDPMHFKYVHTMPEIPESEIEYGDDGYFMRMISRYANEQYWGGLDVTLERDSWGLGLTSVRLKGIPDVGLLMFTSTSPIDRSHTHSRWVFTVTSNLVDTLGQEFIDGMSQGVEADRRIWENKIYRARPVLCEGDAFLGPFRQWARKFYSEAS
jgi:phenylpropionate dioxygenase-like ring-hydroxylating dioxygenase large terminal subunit